MNARSGLLLAAFALAGGVTATPQFRRAAIPQLHYDEGNPLWELDRRVMACTFCHVKESGGAPWNSFGQALQAQFRADAQAGRKSRFPVILYDRLNLMQDADGDGHADALEIFARTLPGDPNSTPGKPVADLTREFQAAGGMSRYAPATTGTRSR